MINYNYDCSACAHGKVCRIIPRDIIDFAYKHDLDEFITVDIKCNNYIGLVGGPKTNRKED